MTEFRTVFTVMFFDENRNFIAESRDIDTYQEAENIGEIVAQLSDDIAYFSIERYFKKVTFDDPVDEDFDEWDE